MTSSSLKEHEKFFSFVLLGAALMTMAVILYIRPIPDSTSNSGVLQILNMIIGALISAFGGAANALFRINDPSEQKKIGEETAKALASSPEPVPVEETAGKQTPQPPMFTEGV